MFYIITRWCAFSLERSKYGGINVILYSHSQDLALLYTSECYCYVCSMYCTWTLVFIYTYYCLSMSKALLTWPSFPSPQLFLDKFCVVCSCVGLDKFSLTTMFAHLLEWTSFPCRPYTWTICSKVGMTSFWTRLFVKEKNQWCQFMLCAWANKTCQGKTCQGKLGRVSGA